MDQKKIETSLTYLLANSLAVGHAAQEMQDAHLSTLCENLSKGLGALAVAIGLTKSVRENIALDATNIFKNEASSNNQE